MKLGTLFAINAVIAFVYGVAFIVAPVQLVAPYGVTLNPGTVLISRLFGGALIGYAIISWRVRAADAPEALRTIAFALFVSDTLGTVITVQGILAGAQNALGWTTAVLYAGLAAGFAYFAYSKPAPRPA